MDPSKTQKIKDLFSKILGYLLLRLQEPSTWRGIVLVLTATGTAIKPTWAQAIVTFGMLAAGLVGIIFPDFVKKAEEADDHHHHGGYDYGDSVDVPDQQEGDVTVHVTRRAPR